MMARHGYKSIYLVPQLEMLGGDPTKLTGVVLLLKWNKPR